MDRDLEQQPRTLSRAKELDYYKEIYLEEYEKKWGQKPILVRGDVFLESLKYVLRNVYGVEL